MNTIRLGQQCARPLGVPSVGPLPGLFLRMPEAVMTIPAITAAMWEVLDRMKRAGVRLAWQRGNGRDYPDTVWWLHGVYSGYQVPAPVSIQGLIDRGLITVVEIGEPPANVWRLGLTDAGERVWGQERAA